ncbi:NAD(P)-dependent dehydrogenase, short-chain alcohol dehydrogenase family [Melghirimyces thermohalophilus]|uniref:NAD(P)-dependent dehydrogenase, short-chain alcohol dehydrogenase family n=1 Tax=Melghirimyces thermohalophilus TaxID=1236220 RepID=A0A1G6IPP8_9BACL|nr:SDR family oxidoreductase [Melghirimyces thermohalophilus]SDC08458.1 NAD(P)-dependent dehydrogenase, short-chain alcohol dehydrogenase family [Melghirimyces thermohalophilus]
MRLVDQVAVITGAGSGIGRATAKKFAREGATVVAADINADTGEETVASIQEEGGEATFQTVDTSSYESVEALVAHATERHGRLDIMFNNAGVANQPYPVLKMPVEEYHRTVSVNQHGVFYGIKAAAQAMKERGGVIINTASIYAQIADRFHFPYHASKGAVVMMTKSAALELARYNIRVVGVAPGLIDTGIVTEWKNDAELWKKIERAHMRRRAGQPEEIANVVAFLASDEATFLNGHVYFADDGAASFKR